MPDLELDSSEVLEDLVNNGMSVKQMAELLEVSVSTINRALKRLGLEAIKPDLRQFAHRIETRSKTEHPVILLEAEKLNEALFQDGANLNKVAARFGVEPYVVDMEIRRHNIIGPFSKRIKPISKQVLLRLLPEKTLVGIARQFEIPVWAVIRDMKKYGIVNPKTRKRSHHSMEIIRQTFLETKSIKKSSKILKMSPTTVKKRLMSEGVI